MGAVGYYDYLLFILIYMPALNDNALGKWKGDCYIREV
jgi:hypothetical protein